MKHWFGAFCLLFLGHQSAFADNLMLDKSGKSTSAIFLGLIVISVIVFTLIRKQKRRFND